MKLLIVEDERDLAEAVAAVLRRNNYSVDCAYDGEYGLDCALTGIYDIIMLDIMLPKLDGLRVLAEIRKEGIATPVLMLTARGEVGDKVLGLDSGADDYLPKPFHMDELLARLRSLGRRKERRLVSDAIQLGSLRFSPQALTLGDEHGEIGLTLKEAQLLELLLAHKGSYVSKESIILKLWGYDADVEDNHVESHVSLLRKKISSFDSEAKIKTARGVGYRIEVANV